MLIWAVGAIVLAALCLVYLAFAVVNGARQELIILEALSFRGELSGKELQGILEQRGHIVGMSTVYNIMQTLINNEFVARQVKVGAHGSGQVQRPYYNITDLGRSEYKERARSLE